MSLDVRQGYRPTSRRNSQTPAFLENWCWRPRLGDSWRRSGPCRRRRRAAAATAGVAGASSVRSPRRGPGVVGAAAFITEAVRYGPGLASMAGGLVAARPADGGSVARMCAVRGFCFGSARSSSFSWSRCRALVLLVAHRHVAGDESRPPDPSPRTDRGRTGVVSRLAIRIQRPCMHARVVASDPRRHGRSRLHLARDRVRITPTRTLSRSSRFSRVRPGRVWLAGRAWWRCKDRTAPPHGSPRLLATGPSGKPTRRVANHAV